MNMNLRSMALAGVMLLAVPLQSFAVDPVGTDKTTVNSGVVIGPGQVFSNAFNVLAGSFTFNLTADGSNKDTAGGVRASLLNAAMDIVTYLELNVVGKNAYSITSNSFSLAAGSYQIMWTGLSTGTGAIKGTASLFGAQTVPVPGPEAGAGIGALAMAGLAYAVVRRRKIPLAR